jgi:hypothetical protein
VRQSVAPSSSRSGTNATRIDRLNRANLLNDLDRASDVYGMGRQQPVDFCHLSLSTGHALCQLPVLGVGI